MEVRERAAAVVVGLAAAGVAWAREGGETDDANGRPFDTALSVG